MAKFHVNPNTGDAGKCSSTQGRCPFGGEADHYTSQEAARSAYETSQGKEHSLDSARNDLALYGESASVFRTWAKIPADFKVSTDGQRKVLANGGGLGTVLTPWHGPKVLEQLKKTPIELAPSIEPSPPMAGWTMTANVMELEKVSKGERYYDKYGSAYEVASVGAGSTGREIEAKMRVLDDDGIPIGDEKAAGIVVSSKRNSPSKFYKLTNLQNILGNADPIPGRSSSKAISDLPAGKGRYDYAALASLTYTNEAGQPEQIELLTPIGRLTDKKRIELGRQLWAFTGKNPQQFEAASDAGKLLWANQRIMRRKNFEWDNDNGNVSYKHDLGVGVKEASRLKIVKLGD